MANQNKIVVEELASNILIAQFMGNKPYEDTRYGTVWADPTNKGRVGLGLKYDTSWDWLMPVVKKIEKDRCVVIASQSDKEHLCSIGIGWITCRSERKIDAVYSAVIQFIQWYNQTTQI